MDLIDVLGSTIQDAGFDDHEFEELVGFLLREEVERRHRGATVVGPVKKGKGDGGRDVEVTVHNPPRTPRDDAGPCLTQDALGTTWFSCKTTTRRRGWLAGVKVDVGWTHWKQQTVPDKTTRPSVELLEALAHGARYVVVINEEAGAERKFLDDLAQVFEFWFDRHPELNAPLPAPADLRQQLEIVEANHLAWIIRSHKPQLPASFRDKLGAIEPPGLQKWESWSKELSAGREPPPFFTDTTRTAIFDALKATGSNAKRVVRVFGAPGLGKTRTVYEALAVLGPDITARARYSNDIRGGQEIVESGWLQRAGGVYLVLDEARTTDVPGVATRFLADATPSARLILVGTSDGEAHDYEHPEIASFPLERLDDAAARKLIESELRARDDPRVASVLDLSEGYPLFAVLLARALADDGDALAHPSDRGAREWLAARRVLAGPRRAYADESAWIREAEIRAKCLLVVLLTHSQETAWDDMWSAYRDAFADALDEVQEWERVKRAERSCVEREILRYSGARTRRYVSPRNLARIILNRFLTDGPHDMGPRIRRYLPNHHASLHALAEQLSVRPEVRDRLARAEWEGFYERVCEDGAEYWTRTRTGYDGLYHAARRVPEFAALRAKCTLDIVTDESLAIARGFRELLRISLNHLSHRKLSAEAFAAVESVLFRLAMFDQEGWANNATSIWQRLFFVMLDGTHRPWAERLALLHARLNCPDIATRRLATAALGVAVGPDERGMAHSEDDRVDGPWPGSTTSLDDLLTRKEKLWSLLVAQCEDDHPEVAEVARAAVAERLRAGIGRGVFADLLQRLTSSVHHWTAAQRQRVSESLEDLMRYEREQLASLPEIEEAVAALAQGLEPTSFRERLLEHVGRWHPGPSKITNEDERPAYEASKDEALVVEALAAPDLLLAELPWLTSEAARRKSPFAARLGEMDVERRFLPALEESAYASKNLVVLARYLEGWALHDAAAVTQWLKTHGRKPELATVAASVLPRLEASQASLHLLRDIVRGADIDPWLLEPLRTERWLDAVPPRELLALLEELATRPTFAPTVVMTGVALLDRALVPTEHQRLIEMLARGARHWTNERIVMVGQRSWRQAIMALWDAEQDDAVIEALLAALAVSNGSGANIAMAHEVLTEMATRRDSPALWDRLARPMLERRPTEFVARPLASAGLLRHVGVDTLLAWVGHDIERGLLAAHMVGVHTRELGELGRKLLVRFGDEGPMGRQLHALARSTPKVQIGGLDDFLRRQLEHAEAWAQLPEPEVQRWAQIVADGLRSALAKSEARASFRQHYG